MLRVESKTSSNLWIFLPHWPKQWQKNLQNLTKISNKMGSNIAYVFWTCPLWTLLKTLYFSVPYIEKWLLGIYFHELSIIFLHVVSLTFFLSCHSHQIFECYSKVPQNILKIIQHTVSFDYLIIINYTHLL